MVVHITKIDIRNFRSYRTVSIQPGKFCVLVGQNDSGKSNLLRALNLFFNGEIGPSEQLNFDIDHNVYNHPNRRAKEISVSLEIELPDSYRANNGDFIIWEKRWRQDGLIYDKYNGYRRSEGRRGATHLEHVLIPDRSNLHGLLRNINYVYVPAIKDPEYVSELRASIYDTISEVADKTFRESSQEFERAISHQLRELTDEISNALGLQSRLALPKDLSHIFESLDFLSRGANISLDVRGDGVKARHIPLILKFMADKKLSLLGRGIRPHTFIWGYEEPENNLELSSCVKLSDQLLSYLNGGISQIFLTTHSPVFYNVRQMELGGSPSISRHHIFNDSDGGGTKETQNPTDLDERMGTMTLFAPLVSDLETRVREQAIAEREAERLAEENKCKIFVEGESDKILIQRALEVFAPSKSVGIDVETGDRGGGYTYVVDMLTGWRSMAKHTPGMPRAAGLVDNDCAAKKAAGSWNRIQKNVDFAKCFRIPTPPHIRPVLNAGFQIPIVLETLYDRAAWEWAKEHGHLCPRDLLPVVPRVLGSKIMRTQSTLEEHLDDDWAIFVSHQFRQSGKGLMARHFRNKNDEEFGQRLYFLEPLIAKIVGYLFSGRSGQASDEGHVA